MKNAYCFTRNYFCFLLCWQGKSKDQTFVLLHYFECTYQVELENSYYHIIMILVHLDITLLILQPLREKNSQEARTLHQIGQNLLTQLYHLHSKAGPIYEIYLSYCSKKLADMSRTTDVYHLESPRFNLNCVGNCVVQIFNDAKLAVSSFSCACQKAIYYHDKISTPPYLHLTSRQACMLQINSWKPFDLWLEGWHPKFREQSCVHNAYFLA